MPYHAHNDQATGSKIIMRLRVFLSGGILEHTSILCRQFYAKPEPRIARSKSRVRIEKVNQAILKQYKDYEHTIENLNKFMKLSQILCSVVANKTLTFEARHKL
jgi:hypothetical protein